MSERFLFITAEAVGQCSSETAPMKRRVTVHFGDVRVVVPCHDENSTVADLAEAAIVRYKKATGKISCLFRVKAMRGFFRGQWLALLLIKEALTSCVCFYSKAAAVVDLGLKETQFSNRRVSFPTMNAMSDG
ncbi:unnamed protein product [Angiostrongylus costaricensis]|uniref:Par3_HAL_N_term domain-containing protein n=1 Tax=Angiostrongylus costaricensis TaxID=334426 RepID=A0A158PHL3_ANGCS|nr:unnamed protein product [Angiostrongylus costaricensis]